MKKNILFLVLGIILGFVASDFIVRSSTEKYLEVRSSLKETVDEFGDLYFGYSKFELDARLRLLEELVESDRNGQATYKFIQEKSDELKKDLVELKEIKLSNSGSQEALERSISEAERLIESIEFDYGLGT
ncbi:hypothetical protein GCM10009092_11420 [Bowmanella denitrificans]|uniref:Uncharacterized protein n=1 Tax=Bowmanella denitrificans TaxID=366582 RepID=A0ABP3GLB5_9ALTE